MTNNKKTIQVVAGIILNAEQTHILMSQRTDAEYIDQWEFPGGKIETGETAEQALVRELKEELNLQAQSYQLFMQKTHEYADKFVDLSFYWVTQFSGEVNGVENQPIAWQAVEDIDKLNFLEANQGVMQKVQQALLAKKSPIK